MKIKIGPIIGLFLLTTSCSDKTTKESGDQAISEPTSSIQYDRIEKQNHAINTNRDTIIICKNGSTVTLAANIFTDSLGNPIYGQIDLVIIEAITLDQILLANLTTTSNGEILQTGGMIYVNASQDNKNLKIKQSESILISIPADSVLSDMRVYEGVEDTKCINWNKPKDLLDSENKNEKAEVEQPELESVDSIIDLKRHNVAYTILDDKFAKNVELQNKVADIILGGKGLVITKDSLIIVDNHKVQLWKQPDFVEWNNNRVDYNWKPVKGTNTFQHDEKTDYVFTMKNLGWANIDRLYDDPRMEEVNIVTSVSNFTDFELVKITLIFNSKSIFIPGYQKKDDTFCFSHNDEEKQNLPINESAKIFAIAYKNDIPYYSIYDFTISKNKKIDMTLKEISMDNLKKELESRL